MPAVYEYEPARDIVVGRLSGVITSREVLDASKKVIEATHGLALRKHLLVLVDQHASLQNIDLEMMTQLKDLVLEEMSRHPGERQVKTAIIVPHGIGTSVFKMWEFFSDNYPMGTRSRIFSKEANALAWFSE